MTSALWLTSMTTTTPRRLPGLILLDLKQEMGELAVVMSDLYSPTLDKDALMDRVFEAIEVQKEADQRIMSVAQDMTHSDGLFEHADYEDMMPRPLIEAAVTKLCHDVKNNLTNLQVYAEGRLLYKFKGMLDGTTPKIVLAPDSDSGQ